MFHTQKARKARNPEVRAAMKERDLLLNQVLGAVEKVDRLQNDLIDEYTQAEEQRGRRWKSP